MLRNRLDEIQNKSAAEKEWWDKRRETIQTEFMKELEEEPAKGSTKVSSDDDAVLVDSTTPVTTPSKKKKGKK